jgi:uncharacterized membrane protein
MYSHFLEYFASLVHILGMILFVGGHIWFSVFSAMAERRQEQGDIRFLVASLPLLATGFGIGVLLLFGSGVLKLLLWGEPGLIFLPDPYGWILLSKLLLYMVIIGNGILIERRYLPHVIQAQPHTPSRPPATTSAWVQVTLRARLNLVLILIVVALGEAMRYSKL